MVYVIPYFDRNHDNFNWIKAQYKRLTFFCGLGNAAITIICIILAPWIVPLIFGAQYIDAVTCFTILMIGYFFSATFRVPTANFIYTQRKVKVNIIITATAGIANCILDVVFTYFWGPIGAAYATTAVNIIASILSVGYMMHLIWKNNSTIPMETAKYFQNLLQLLSLFFTSHYPIFYFYQKDTTENTVLGATSLMKFGLSVGNDWYRIGYYAIE